LINIIETNISTDGNIRMVDFQSRIIEVDSWDSYVNEIGNGDSVSRRASVGWQDGYSILPGCRIENFSYNDHTLKCDVYNRDGLHSKKLAYLVAKQTK